MVSSPSIASPNPHAEEAFQERLRKRGPVTAEQFLGELRERIAADHARIRAEHERRAEAKRKSDVDKEIWATGYKAMAKRLHPDVPGGSHEAMQRLNELKKGRRVK